MRRIPDRLLLFIGAVSLCASIALTLAADAYSHRVRWQHAGASVFGGACEYGATGYRGDYLPSVPMSFAELGMGSALGGLPYRAKIRVLYHGRKITVSKKDIGLGGGSVGGWPRSIDLWEGALYRLLGYHNCNWTAVVRWRRVT